MLSMLISAALAAPYPSQTIAFSDARDPDAIELVDGRTLRIAYGQISPEQVDAFKEGHPLELGYAPERGMFLRDPSSGAEAAVHQIIGGEHLIEVYGAACHDSAHSTADMHDCQKEILSSWQAEVARQWAALEARHSPPEQRAIVRAARDAWEADREAQLDMIRMMYSGRDGTMWGLVAAQEHISLWQDQSERLGGWLSGG